ncbi:large proline-rich protein BAG6 isoform X2 [Tribolium castaneum]|uniref:large proline-rich protein BAG6 isoform X2 n=1 Tax=Tribolium castaneum TaxID=7070 RepID=UPI00046C117E|nr:PREDICTED: large proline-rich protein BAG6 isoform X2 [Tribolium castaneum]|eukprot:XP_015834279.1 PREDICTED: large proline-rich protein BAG6 isoform X2 [Tribolium castaneum]
MIVLTVKTLDSQNHTFTVDDDITVEQFKTKIADTVNIPAETQRIIYCGRVLQDEAKLGDYDVNGKVVHLVQRPPPSQNPPTTRAASPQPPRRGFRGFDTENTMYLGSMAFPSNLMESQGIVPPPPTHSLAGSRLNVARRMLRRAEAVISLLENPSARPNEQATSEEQQEEEVTPIIEARVIVPPGNSDSIDEAMVLSAVQNTLFDAASGSIPMAAEVTIDGSGSSQNSSETPPAERSASSTPEEAAPTPTTSTTASEGTSGEQRNGGVSARTLAENASRTSEMAELLTTLNQLQTRFAPFLERYRHFMVEDPIIPQENVRQTQAMLTRVSEVLHFLGHAYHSLSDIIIRVRTPPPRPLLCRPILIQHSAVVQAGIPIQVEAQFNLSERPNNTSTTTSSAATTTTTETSTNAGDGGARATLSAPQPSVNFRGFPFIPAASMRVQSFPIEVRTTARPVNVVHSTQRTQNNNNNNTVGASENRTPPTTTPPTTSSTFNMPNLNNSSVEFFMEVTPEVLQGTLNGPPPEFLQSLVQMAGQIMNRITTTAPTSDTNTTTTTSPTSNTDSAQSSQATPSQQTASGQNSQARGNTQTNPTTATHTRSTPRPHVHLAQQAMQGGFDPFLPCNSHHVTHRRRAQQATATPTVRQQQGSQATEGGEEGGEQRDRERAASQNLHSLFDEIYSTLRTAYRRRREGNNATGGGARSEGQSEGSGEEASGSTGQATGSGLGFGGGATAGTLPPSLANLLPNLQSTFANLPNMLQGPTIADILQQLPLDESSQENPGESIITDLIMLLSRNLTIVDMITLNTGNFEPLNRVTNEIQQFFTTRVLDGSNSPQAVNAGVDRFINEMQPFFQNFSRLRVNDDIDIVRSVETLFRRRLPDIITTATNLNSSNMRTLVDQCLTLAKMMCALTLTASANGQQGVEETFQQIITSYMQGIPTELQNWTMITSCANLHHFMANLGIDRSEVEPYIVRSTDVPMATPPDPTVQNEVRNNTTQEVESMELDEAEATVELPPLSLSDDSEPVPNIVLGSEPWHSQVPEDWVPIITRDVQRQRRQNTQPPFSDAYLSGMPTKRRKIVNSTKPQGSLPQVIAESVRRAVTVTGLSSVAPVEAVSQGAGESLDVQAAYRSLLRTTVQSALRDNEDFTPERFPNASTYFKTQ